MPSNDEWSHLDRPRPQETPAARPLRVRRSLRLRTAAASVALLAALGGCGDDDQEEIDEGPGTEVVPGEDGPVE